MGSSLPLQSIRAFAEVGRTGSVKAAAEALRVTPGAISQHLRNLESWLGVKLIARGKDGFVLTEAGTRFCATVGDHFVSLDEAVRAFRRHDQTDTLRVNSCGGLATAWLLPRLKGFTQAHPEIDIRVEATSRVVDLHTEPVDVALRPGHLVSSSLCAERFLETHAIAVASPQYLETAPKISAASDLPNCTLLQDLSQTDWPAWLRDQGVQDSRVLHGPAFDDPFLTAQAAIRGLGVALMWDIYIRDELESGRLVPVLKVGSTTRRGYYFVTLPRTAKFKKIQLFRRWLIAEGSKMEPLAWLPLREAAAETAGGIAGPVPAESI